MNKIDRIPFLLLLLSSGRWVTSRGGLPHMGLHDSQCHMELSEGPILFCDPLALAETLLSLHLSVTSPSAQSCFFLLPPADAHLWYSACKLLLST